MVDTTLKQSTQNLETTNTICALNRWIEYLFVKIGFIEGSHILWGFIAQTCGRQEVGVYEDTWLSSIDATIVVFVLARGNGSGAMNGYYVVESCILSHLCEDLEH
jgi:hypothetical protein